MIDDKLDYTPAYEAMMIVLLDYEDRQDELCSLIDGITGRSFDQMDPLTFFSMLNGKKACSGKRTEGREMTIERFRPNVDVPASFNVGVLRRS